MPDYKLIALDLDGTLLNSDKVLTQHTAETLARAAAAGIEIVPASGRFYDAFPEAIRALDFVHYAITINGAQVIDLRQGCPLLTADIPNAKALEIMAYLDTLPVIYDCYMDNWGWMTEAMRARIPEFAPNAHYLQMLIDLRRPVPELKAHLAQVGHDVQKIQFFLQDAAQRRDIMAELGRRFPGMSISSAVANNVEINALRANKGDALADMARRLGIPGEQTMAFGDELNDLSMVKAAGLGVAMGNAVPELKAAAGYVTADCDADGVALAIEKFCLQGGISL